MVRLFQLLVVHGDNHMGSTISDVTLMSDQAHEVDPSHHCSTCYLQGQAHINCCLICATH